MDTPPSFGNHNIFPHCVYHDLTVPSFTPPERYAALQTQAFIPRPDDIVIATFPKSGTTWLQNTVYNLLGCPNGPIERINHTVPWLQSVGVTLEDIEKMEGPRVFTTHDYWSWMPEKLRNTARFIYCARNPKDQAVSYFHHLQNMKASYGQKCSDMTFNEYFDQIYSKKDVAEFGLWEDHNLEWLGQTSRKNILFLTYEDMKENSEREIRKMSEFLGLFVDEQRITDTLNKSRFEYMRNSDNLNLSWHLRGSKDFIRKGNVGGWVDYLIKEQSAYFEKPIQRIIEAGGKVRCYL